MAKIIKNVTASGISLKHMGLTIPASDQITVEEQEYLYLGREDSITELSGLISAGDLVVNDGIGDLSADRGIDFLQYPDWAFGNRFLSEPERSNGLSSKNIQEAIEEVADAVLTSGLDEYDHRDLDQLVHMIAEDSYEEITYSGNQVTNITIWTDSGKTTKIREEQYAYTGNKINTVTTIQYGELGVAEETLTETFTYTGNKVTSVDKVLT